MDDTTAAAAASDLILYLESLADEEDGDDLSFDRRAFLQNISTICDLELGRRRRLKHRKRRNDGDSDEEDVEEPPGKKAKPADSERGANEGAASTSKLAATAQQRVDVVLRDALSLNISGVTPTTLAVLIVEDNTGHMQRAHAVIEDTALYRALIGFSSPNDAVDPWANLPRYNLTQAPTNGAHPLLDTYCTRSLDLSRSEVDHRLSERGSWLGIDPFGGVRWVIELVKKIEMLRFDSDYAVLVAGDGGKRRQNDILDKLFRAWLPADQKDVLSGTEEGKALRKSFNDYFAKQRRSRNRLRDLYHNLGPAVLIDPFWTLDTCYWHRSKAFPEILNTIYKELKGDPADDVHTLQIRYTDNYRALRSLAEHLGGPVLEQYVVSFLRDQPSLSGREIEEQLGSQLGGGA